MFALFLFMLPNYVTALPAGPTFTESRVVINESGSYMSYSKISGNHVVWDETVDDDYQLFLIDLEDPELTKTQLTTEGVIDFDLSGENIIYVSGISGTLDLYYKKISEPDSEGVKIFNYNGEYQYSISISGSIAVWESDESGQYEIYMCDLSQISDPDNISITMVSSGDGNNRNPQISGNNVIWSAVTLNEIWISDISDPEKISSSKLMDRPSGFYEQSFSGNYFTWSTNSFGEDIYFIDINHASDIIRVTDNDYIDELPSVSGNYIAWDAEDPETGYFNIMLYDITSGQTYPVTTSANEEFWADIDGNRIIWQDNRDELEPDTYDPMSIYMATMAWPDTTSPIFSNLPDSNSPINITEGQNITTNPYIINVKPTDENGISKVEFYVDGTLICTDTTADAEGVYSCSWDTSKYHSRVDVYAYDTSNNRSVVLTRNANVDPSLYLTILPKTGKTAR
jgi:hypothetical protein